MKYEITVDDLVQDLQLAKEIAIKNENVTGLINSVMSQAKLLGLENGEQNKATNNPMPISVTVSTVDARKRDEV